VQQVYGKKTPLLPHRLRPSHQLSNTRIKPFSLLDRQVVPSSLPYLDFHLGLSRAIIPCLWRTQPVDQDSLVRKCDQIIIGPVEYLYPLPAHFVGYLLELWGRFAMVYGGEGLQDEASAGEAGGVGPLCQFLGCEAITWCFCQ